MKERYSKEVDMLDKQSGKYLQTFPSLSEAARWLIENHYSRCSLKGLHGHISHACQGIRQSVAGFRWRFHADEEV